MNISLESLVGEHKLSGVDMSKDTTENDYASVCRFRLDGKVYTCTEDPEDGYRSCMGSLELGGEINNRFAPQKVICSYQSSACELLVMVDAKTGKTVLTIGTDNMDDYYPYFVAHFEPENMACNQNKLKEIEL